jgi:hypothetical protein
LIVSPKFEGTSLFPISQWPMPVYVSRILDDTVLTTRSFTPQQVELITWGTLTQKAEAIQR